jgi:glycosyltransferase involved in cell wall biosynthesis
MKIVLFANTDWYLYNFRLSLAETIKAKGHKLVLLSPRGPYVQKLKEMGYSWKEVKLNRKGFNPYEEIKTILTVRSIYKIEKPDLVHHFTIKCVIYGSIAGKILGVRKIINSITGLGFIFLNDNFRTRSIRWFVKAFYRISLKNTEVVFQNEDDCDLFINNHLVKQEQVTIIPGSGVDTDKFKPEKEPEGIPTVILIGRMLRDKGIFEFIEAARLINQSKIQARFILVGDIDAGNPASLTKELLQDWVHKGIAEWWGWSDDVVNIYHQASIVCLPSYREGISKTLIEAGASGKPLIASNVPGCRQIIVDGKNGFLVPQKNVGALVKALVKLISNPELRKVMGINSREIIVQKFSSKTINGQTINLYESLRE